MKRRVVSKKSVKRFAASSTKASAHLERRDVPAGFISRLTNAETALVDVAQVAERLAMKLRCA